MSDKPWPADKVERWPIDKLVEYARNSRTHAPEQIDRIAASIREWGWTSPVLAKPDGTIIAGHARYRAAKKLGLNEVPVMPAEGWSEAQIKAYVLADNALAINGSGWDADLLRLELSELAELDFDLDLTGFSGEELAGFLAEPTEGLTDPDNVPEVPETPVSVSGDVWLLGKHRLVCGDCTDADAVAKAFNGVTPHLMVTDPPYGVEYDPQWRDRAAASGKMQRFAKNVGTGKVSNDENADWREAWALFPGEVAYIWHAGIHAPAVAESLVVCGFELRGQIIWAKSRFAIGRGHYHWQHEPCWYAVKKGGKGYWSGDRSQSTLWQIDHRKSDTGHGTQKPVECMKRPIENNSSPGQAVYEPFAGSFTTGIACEMTGRACHAIELDPGYIDVGIKRWMTFTGKHATLEGDGRTFAQIAEERLGPIAERIKEADLAAG